jgi:hypothetical protein
MQTDIPSQCVEIKATLQKLQHVKVSPTARLVALLEACGVTDTQEVASLVGRSVRMVQVARNELRETNCADAKPIAQDATHFAKPIAPSETHCAENETHCASRARKVTNKPILLGEVSNNKTPLPPKRGASPFECLQAFEAYNALALRVGIPQAAKLTKDRERKIAARLKDYGADGWQQALANIERSSFLTGTNDRGWTASLDFLVQAGSFSKVHDGGYGNGRHAKGERKAWDIPSKPREPDDQAWMDSIAEKYA